MLRRVSPGLFAALFLCVTPAARADMYLTTLTGAAEAPPNASPGLGVAIVTFDPVAHILRIQTTFGGLLGTVTAAHIHAATATPGAGTAGVATQLPSLTGFPTGVTLGAYDHTFDSSLAATWNPAYIAANGGTTAGAEAALLAALNGGKAYLNIHTSSFPGGEIRGFLSPVPEPSQYVLALLGGIGFLATRLRRTRR
ncbi:MAG: CHRD domain-containing protein [Isosphaeraceae bacterium]